MSPTTSNVTAKVDLHTRLVLERSPDGRAFGAARPDSHITGDQPRRAGDDSLSQDQCVTV